VSPPGAVCPIGGKIQGAEIPPLAKSHGSKSNALAYIERALSSVDLGWVNISPVG